MRTTPGVTVQFNGYHYDTIVIGEAPVTHLTVDQIIARTQTALVDVRQNGAHGRTNVGPFNAEYSRHMSTQVMPILTEPAVPLSRHVAVHPDDLGVSVAAHVPVTDHVPFAAHATSTAPTAPLRFRETVPSRTAQMDRYSRMYH